MVIIEIKGLEQIIFPLILDGYYDVIFFLKVPINILAYWWMIEVGEPPSLNLPQSIASCTLHTIPLQLGGPWGRRVPIGNW